MKKSNTFFAVILYVMIFSFQNSFAQYSLVYEDFEDNVFPPAGWITADWYQASGVSGYGVGDKCAEVVLYYNCFGYFPLDTPPFSASEIGDELIFDYAYAPLDKFNYHDLNILYSLDNGSTYKYLYTLSGYPGGELTTADPTFSYFSPGSNQWKTFIYSLPEGTTNIKFEPNGTNCSNNLFIDNVKIGHEVPYTDVAVKQVYSKGRYARTFLSNDTISAYIKNAGNQDVNNLKVYLNISGTNLFKDSLEITTLPAGSFEVVKFRPFNPVLNGNGVVKVSILHNDEVAGNDSALYNLNVNTNYLSYTDTIASPGGFGSYNRIYFFNKYYLTNANTRISEIRTRIQNFEGNYIPDQIITGVLLDNAGTIIAKSEPYKLQTTDTGKYISLKLSNPLPFYPAVANTYFYAGIESSEPIRDDYFFSFTGHPETPSRQNAFYYSYDRSKEVGENLLYIYDLGTFNYQSKYVFEVKIDNMPAVDAGVSNLGSTYEQYYNTTTISQNGKVFNNAISGTANATVIRTISPGGYTNSQSVSIPANSSVNVTFANWTFTSGTTYSIRDSIILSGDVNLTNNVMKGIITPHIAKDMVIFYQKKEDKDSLERAINTDGRYANNYDAVDLNYRGSFRPWKIVFANPKFYTIFENNTRDSLKAFLDNSTGGNKKTLAVFATKLASTYTYGTLGDTIFMKQYLRATYAHSNWMDYFYDSENRFKGNGFFDGVTQDSLSLWLENTIYSGGEQPDLIRPVNGSSIAFLPQTADPFDVFGNAVCYTGANYNTFFMTNRFSALRSSSGSPSLSMGPVRVYTKIIDWIQNINTGAKVLDLTSEIEGFYDPSINSMVQDTMRVYLRSDVSPFAKIDSAKAFMNSAGQASFVFNNASNGTPYYIHLQHRNSLETWSESPQTFSSNHVAYDFTSNSTQAYGSNMILADTKWVIYTGDVDQNGLVDLTDLLLVFNDASLFITGYVNTDVNGDNLTDLTDIVLTFNNSNNFIEKKTPLNRPSLFSRIESLPFTKQHHEIKTADEFSEENKTDNLIYEKHKNEQVRPNENNRFKITEKGNGNILFERTEK